MSEFITQTFYFIGSYALLAAVIFFSIEWLSKGWLSSFLRVRSSMGKKLLLRIHTQQDTYYRTGQLIDDALLFQIRGGKKCRIPRANIPKGAIHMESGVWGLNVDEEKNVVYDRTEAKASPITATEVDNLLVRAIEAPTINNKKDIIMFALLAIILLAVGISLYMVIDLSQQVATLQQVSGVI